MTDIFKLTEYKLIHALNSAISSQDSTELAVLHLFNRDDIDPDDLQRLIRGLYCSFKTFI
jgi:hypothetical protein